MFRNDPEGYYEPNEEYEVALGYMAARSMKPRLTIRRDSEDDPRKVAVLEKRLDGPR